MFNLAKNLGAKAIFIANPNFEIAETDDVFIAENWQAIYEFLKLPPRKIAHERTTKETKIFVELNLDGNGKSEISTGISFFDHMLEQIARHGNIDLKIEAKGDLHIDEHHTIEDVAITLGEAFALALQDKRGMERYGFALPMDDCLAQVAIDFGGRNWCVWEAEFKRENIGKMPTEMFFHFFKSFSDKAMQLEYQSRRHKRASQDRSDFQGICQSDKNGCPPRCCQATVCLRQREFYENCHR